jgi:hypothetical protein
MTKKEDSWFKRNKETLEFLMLLATVGMMLATFYQAMQSKEQVVQSKRAIDLQYTPRVYFEVSSPKISTVISENSYQQADYIFVYKNELIKSQDAFGKTSVLPESSFPINITIQNLGSFDLKLLGIKQNFSCDPKGERDMQIDILKSRVIPAGKDLSYSNFVFLNFGAIPQANVSCNLELKFLFDGLEKSLNYRILYWDTETSHPWYLYYSK